MRGMISSMVADSRKDGQRTLSSRPALAGAGGERRQVLAGARLPGCRLAVLGQQGAWPGCLPLRRDAQHVHRDRTTWRLAGLRIPPAIPPLGTPTWLA